MIKFSKFFLLLTLLLPVAACVDTQFDDPEVAFSVPDDKIISIADVMTNLPGIGSVQLTDEVLGSDDLYVSGVVSADDESGNLFKVIYFQDESGALQIEPDQNELNAAYPEGSIIYVRLNGLYLLRDANVPKLAYALDGNFTVRTPDALVKTIIFSGGPAESPVTPEIVTLADVANNSANYFNRLVSIQDVELTSEFLGGTYAIADGIDGPETVNAMLQDCNGREIILRNSGFSNFANQTMPFGNGSVTCIVSKFSDDLQLFIREPNDLDLAGDRCDGSVVSGEFPDNEVSLADAKSQYLDLGVDKLPDGFIQGVVISDRAQQNITNRNLVLQTNDAGIVLRFSDAHSYNLGEVLKVNVTGRSFSTFNGLTQIDGMSALAIRQEGSSALPAPVVVTAGEMSSNIYNYESIRVKIEDATISGPTYSFNLDVTDATGTIVTFIQTFAAFNGQSTPTGSVDIVGYGGLFNDPQILINGPSDITGGGGGGGGNPGTSDVNQDFDGQTDFEPVDYTGWLNISVKGQEPWYFRSFDDNGFAECEAFQANSSETESWLVTPTIDTDETAIIEFETAQAFWQHQGLSVWVSPNFTDFADANWTEITSARIANDSDDQYDFVPSGEIDLKALLGGEVRVGWRYVGTSAANTTKVRIDNVQIK